MSIYDETATERRRAHAKHGAKSMEGDAWDDPRRLRILLEEVGEIARVFNDLDLGVITEAEARVQCRTESIQVAAMAAAWADSAYESPGTPEDAATRAALEAKQKGAVEWLSRKFGGEA